MASISPTLAASFSRTVDVPSVKPSEVRRISSVSPSYPYAVKKN